MNERFTVEKVSNSIYVIGEFKHYEEVLSYLIIGKNNALLIDTGMGVESIRNVVRKITDKKVVVVNTHYHFDHIGGNHEFKDIYIHHPDISITIAKKGISYEEIKKMYPYVLPKPLGAYSIQRFAPGEILQNYSIINIHPFQFQIINTPGHSKDSIVIYNQQTGILFSGDTIHEGNISVNNLTDYRKTLEYIYNLNNLSYIYGSHNSRENQRKTFMQIYQKVGNVPGKIKINEKTILHIRGDYSKFTLNLNDKG